MTTDEERELLAQELLRLSLPGLVDVLRRVLPAFGEQDADSRDRLVLAQVGQMRGPGALTVEMEPWIQVVAWPDRDYYDGGFGPEPGLYESGRCVGCGVEVTSTAKRAFCAVCGNVCYLT